MANKILELDGSFYPQGDLAWTKGLADLVVEFEKNYAKHSGEKDNAWMKKLIKEHLPKISEKEIDAFVKNVEDSLNTAEEKKSSLTAALSKGRSKENWFAEELQRAVSTMSTADAAKYIGEIDSALKTANANLFDSLKTKSGLVNMNPKLDGFIAEQYHAKTFNMNAAVAGSKYRAEVLTPEGKTFAKNSVDIVVKDTTTGKIVQRYQSKYCKDPMATQAAIDHGDYVGQQYLVAEGQADGVRSKATETIVSPDGVSSNPLPKTRAEQMRNEAQSGKWDELNWDEYKLRDLSIGIGKQAGLAGMQGAAVGAGFKVVENLFETGHVDGEEVVEAALKTGVDYGVKSAAAGAMKVAAEKGIIDFFPKGTPAATYANVAFVAIEDAKILGKMANGELDLREGVDALESTTISCAAGLAAGGKAGAIGAALGSVFGPAGTFVGGAVGSIVGYVAGSTVGRAVVKGAQMIRDVAYEGIKAVGRGICSIGSAVKNFACGVLDTLTGGCFITTAICYEYGKADDCYELTTLRNFRDNWLANQPLGKKLIDDYYSIAPSIVKRINSLPNRKSIYRSLDVDYLSKCISYIESGSYEKCKEKYVEMVKWIQSYLRKC